MKLCPAPHIRVHSKMYRPADGARNMIESSSRPRFGTVTLTSVPTMRNPCDVSSLLTRSSTCSPSSITIRECEKSNRSAVMWTTRGGGDCGDAAPVAAITATIARIRGAIQIDVMSEPPAEADVEAVRRLHDRGLIPLDDVIEFHGDVGIRIVRRAEHPRVAIELLQRKQSSRHAILG